MSSNKLTILTTNDGSKSICRDDINENYHSIHGALQESLHVFIEAGLQNVIGDKKELVVFEVGFGTGLNAILASRFSEKNAVNILYQSVESFPLDLAVVKELSYSDFLTVEEYLVFSKMHTVSWNEAVVVSQKFKLHKMEGLLSDVSIPRKADVVFFDAFSPGTQPELWTVEVFLKMYKNMNSGGVLVTYCAKGQVRRNMVEAGFKVERIQGPPGKREMLRATRG